MNTFTLDIPQSRGWTDEDLFVFCTANRNLRIEWDAHGFIITPLSGGLSSYYISTLIADLVIWNRSTKRGKIFESSAGFLLPDGSMRAPDIAFVSREKWQNLTAKQKEQFLPLCPEFVVEVRSPSDRLTSLQEKMKTWIANGCQLAWLLDPKEETAWIYRPEKPVQIVSDFDQTLSGEAVLEGFAFELAGLRE